MVGIYLSLKCQSAMHKLKQLYLMLSTLNNKFLFIFVLGVHCDIYKRYYNIS
jgi:hypothetical protein